MSMETELRSAIESICARCYPDVAPAKTPLPYTVWQQIGGQTMRYEDNTPMDKRWPLVQVAVWSATRLEAIDLIRQIEEALCAAAFTADPQGEPVSVHEPDTGRYGSIQRFTIWASR